jgi:hypothetical protein
MRSVVFGWVKNVYSLGVTGGTTSGVLSPVDAYHLPTAALLVGQVPVVLVFVPRLLALLSTSTSCYLSLLFATYTHYPQPLLIEPKKKI